MCIRDRPKSLHILAIIEESTPPDKRTPKLTPSVFSEILLFEMQCIYVIISLISPGFIKTPINDMKDFQMGRPYSQDPRV